VKRAKKEKVEKSFFKEKKMRNFQKMAAVSAFSLLLGACSTLSMSSSNLPLDYICEEEVVMAPVSFAKFDFDSYKLKKEMISPLDTTVQMLHASPELNVVAKGYADAVGTKAYNKKLGEKRAISVAREMIKKGIDPQRITVESYGEDYPVASNKTDDGRALNRRVVLDFMK